jgi:ATP-dependent DNA helicase RecG
MGHIFYSSSDLNENRLTFIIDDLNKKTCFLKGLSKCNQYLSEQLGESQRNIIALMKKNIFITIPELSQQLAISETAIQNNIKKLKACGLVDRIGPDKGGYWQVIQDKQKK